jgi:hypothetical protein
VPSRGESAEQGRSPNAPNAYGVLVTAGTAKSPDQGERLVGAPGISGPIAQKGRFTAIRRS